MGFFKKQPETITISSVDEALLTSLHAKIKAAKIKDTTVSPVVAGDGAYQCSIACREAEAVYSATVLPLLDGSDDPNLFEMNVEFEDKSGQARFYSKEVLTSLRFDSGRAFGDETEREFMRTLIAAVTGDMSAVAYVIMSGGALTISVPSAEPEKMRDTIIGLLKSHHVTLFEANIVSRESA